MEKPEDNIELPLEIFDLIIKYLSPRDKYYFYKGLYQSDISEYIFNNLINSSIMNDHEKEEFFASALQDKNNEIIYKMLKNFKINPETLLILGIRYGNNDVIDEAIDGGANNLNDALMEAANVKNYGLVNNLISWGADPYFALLKAIEKDDFNLVDDLINKYPKFGERYSLEKAFYEVSNISNEMILNLIDLGAIIFREAAVHAVSTGDADLFREIVDLYDEYLKNEHRYKRGRHDNFVSTALSEISKVRDMEKVKIFIDRYFDLIGNMIDIILSDAVENNNLDIIKYLIPIYHINDSNLIDAKHRAYNIENQEIFDYLTEIGVKLDIPMEPIVSRYYDKKDEEQIPFSNGYDTYF